MSTASPSPSPSRFELFSEACDIYGGDHSLVKLLFNSNVPAFSNKKPNELMDYLEVRILVSEWLNKIKYGEFS
ncbi:hypothetical protein A9267_21120 [Shewanella sp. UCD-FRSSP16_17]|nr:antitoxin Xre/MbcA/ParS toxin-binding domain-containing protein [Shewanella sp. UCD-FRSSP16_17]OBT09339.1 hypothetical protein A9267_21120 [Shewanella sp. UCD-FRSSP16_17]